jgi:hypothetical protein
MAEELPLGGGNISAGVVRVGDTVRRPLTPASPAVHALLRHLEARGFRGCPRLLGVDGRGREVLTFLPGEVGFMPFLWEGDDALVAAARLLRAYHEAAADFVPPPDAAWGFVHPDPARREIICHNDFAPYNLVCADGRPYALIDFDMAGPGPRLRDLAYAAYWMVPLWMGGDLSGAARRDREAGGRRLRLFCDTYGIPATPALLDTADEVLTFLGDWLEAQARAGSLACQKMIADGHLAGWRRERAAFRAGRPALERTLARVPGL